ncbi:MAG TPA: hypothetical protein VGL84_08585 [Gaiellaceae bacterium]
MRQLANTSDLFGLLLAYTELALFTVANTRSDPSALLQATHEVALAEPQLVAASLALKG